MNLLGTIGTLMEGTGLCVPIFAAAGHFSYLKSAFFYVQEMSKLNSSHPNVLKKFEKGFYVICCTDKFWAALSQDLSIEQTLMRSLKTSGGLTHGCMWNV
jgi:hypothetical protein